HSSSCVVHIFVQLACWNCVNDAAEIGGIAQQAGYIGHNCQVICMQGSSDSSSSAITIDVQALSLPTECQRCDDGRVACIKQLLEQPGVYLLNLAGIIVSQDLYASLWRDRAHYCFTPGEQQATINTSQPQRVHALLLQKGHQFSIDLSGYSHRKNT